MTLAELRRRREEIETELRTIHDEAGDQPLTDDQQTRWDELETERSDVRQDIADREARQRVIDNMGEGSTGTAGEPGTENRGAPETRVPADPYGYDDTRMTGREVRSRALSAVEATEHLPDEHRERVVEMLERHDTQSGALARHVVATGRPAYRSAFARIIGGEQHLLTDEERHAVSEARAMSLTDAAGGYAVPFTIDPTIIATGDLTANPMRQIARVDTIVSDTWRGITRGAGSARWAAESSEANDNSFPVDRPEVPVHRADSFVPFSVEIQGDWAGLEAEARAAISEARDELEAEAHMLGDGDGKPHGVLPRLGAAQTVSTGGAFSSASLYALRAALSWRYRRNASFAGELGVYQAIRQFDTAGGADLWVQLGGSEPDRLLGHPAYEFGAMHDDPTTNDEDILAFGDFRNYLIVDRVGLVVELVPHLFGENGRPTGERGFFAWWRTGGDVLVPDAFRKLAKTA